jgi:hypothetical protein
MAELVCVRVDWDRTAIPLRLSHFHTIRLGPEAAHPFGRKGAALAGAWRQLSGRRTDGMVILDGDVAVDLLDVAAMRASIHVKPDAVHVAPVRLWPASTHDGSWHWAHWNTEPTQDLYDGHVRRFSFCFTYLPRPLIDRCIQQGLEGWTFPHVDRLVSLQAQQAKTPVIVVPACTPKHLHF